MDIEQRLKRLENQSSDNAATLRGIELELEGLLGYKVFYSDDLTLDQKIDHIKTMSGNIERKFISEIAIELIKIAPGNILNYAESKKMIGTCIDRAKYFKQKLLELVK